jgi:hypothetical protein
MADNLPGIAMPEPKAIVEATESASLSRFRQNSLKPSYLGRSPTMNGRDPNNSTTPPRSAHQGMDGAINGSGGGRYARHFRIQGSVPPAPIGKLKSTHQAQSNTYISPLAGVWFFGHISRGMLVLYKLYGFYHDSATFATSTEALPFA